MKIWCPKEACIGYVEIPFLKIITSIDQEFNCYECKKPFVVYDQMSKDQQNELIAQLNVKKALGIVQVKTVEGKEVNFEILKDHITVGRKSLKQADIQIETSDNTMSRLHFELFYSKKNGGRFTLKTLKPLNGTYIEFSTSKDGSTRFLKEIKTNQEVYLENGMVIQCGKTKMMINVCLDYQEKNRIKGNKGEFSRTQIIK